MSDKTVLTLTTPIKAHGEDTGALAFREPTGKTIRDCGLPYAIVYRGTDTEMRYDTGAVAKLIAALADIPLSAVDKLSAPDFQAAMGIVAGFFAPQESAASLAATAPMPAAAR